MNQKTNKLVPRSPIVVVMGHIDHGKSKLLDFIRKTSVVEGEAGGITQHMGAYETEVKCDEASHGHKTKKITFIDTPGHEAFSNMRIHGATIADVAILVVAADEGPKTQTLEAHKAIVDSKTPFVVALNKMDKPNADPERVKMQLTEKGIFVEGYGGTAPCANISAKTGEGIDELLDIVLLLAEVEELRGDPSKNASGFVLEAKMDPQKGISATLLVRDGTMRKGTFVSAGNAIAPVKIFEDFKGKAIETAVFSSPVRIIGFSELPEPGVEFKTFDTKIEAETEIIKFKESRKELDVSADTMSAEKDAVAIIIKTDVAGSLEALVKEISKTKSDVVKTVILRKSVGTISESDIKLIASAKEGIVLGFNVGIDSSAKELAERYGTEIFTSNIIYKISEWFAEKIKEKEKIKKGGKGKIAGSAKILKTFSKTKNKQVVGGKVEQEKIREGWRIKIVRDSVEIGEGKIAVLQHNKAPVKEVAEGDEFGAMIDSQTDILTGDEIIYYN